MIRLTMEEIDAAKTERGGWTKDTLAGWGISWPPPKGWKEMLVGGMEVLNETPNAPESHPYCLEAKLLHEVVMMLIETGRGYILCEIDSLNEYYQGGLPTVEAIIGGRPETAIIEGGITWEDKVYRFSVARMVGK